MSLAISQKNLGNFKKKYECSIINSKYLYIIKKLI